MQFVFRPIIYPFFSFVEFVKQKNVFNLHNKRFISYNSETESYNKIYNCKWPMRYNYKGLFIYS